MQMTVIYNLIKYWIHWQEIHSCVCIR